MRVGLPPLGGAWGVPGGGSIASELTANPEAVARLGWKKMKGLLPAIVQDERSGRLLGMGFMDKPALEQTLQAGLVYFDERSSRRVLGPKRTPLSGLHVRAIYPSSDAAALLLLVDRKSLDGAGQMKTAFDVPPSGPGWLAELARLVADTDNPERPTSHFFDLQRIAQEFGEQSVDVAIAGVCRDSESCIREIARLLLVLATLIEARGLEWGEIICDLQRHYAARRELAKPAAEE